MNPLRSDDDMRRLMEAAGRRREQRDAEWAEIQAERERRRRRAEAPELFATGDREAALEALGIRRPEGALPLEAVPTCEACRDTGTPAAEIPAWAIPELCERHAAEAESALAVAALAHQIDPAHLRAPAAHLHPELAAWDVRNARGFYLFGKGGRGKTDSAAILCRRAYRQLRTVGGGRVPSIRWFPVTTAIERIQRSFRTAEGFDPTPLHEADLLVLDDIGMEKATDWARSLLYTIVNERMVHSRPTGFTSNLSPGRLAAHLEAPPIASRIAGSCDQVEFTGPDWRLS